MGIFIKFLDLIYPPRCHICQGFLFKPSRETPQICPDCLNNLARIASPLCTRCGTPFESQVETDHLCEGCLRRPPVFDALIAPYLYEGGIMEAIHRIKYQGKTHLAGTFAGPLIAMARERLGETKGMIMIPVPLHPKRLRERGFNQGLILSRAIAPALETRIDLLSLRRMRYTRPQTGLKRDERRKNVKGAFGLAGKSGLKRKTVILVDDVATTGNTLNECARVLKRGGCEKVLCLTLARAVHWTKNNLLNHKRC
jgi:ComF family protein